MRALGFVRLKVEGLRLKLDVFKIGGRTASFRRIQCFVFAEPYAFFLKP